MNTRVGFTALAALVILAAVVWKRHGEAPPPNPSTLSRMCKTNLEQIAIQLKFYVGNGDIYPPCFVCLTNENSPSNLFVCPATGRKPGALTNVDEWTDYIYFANQGDYHFHVPLIICPPENHGGKSGNILLGNLERSRISHREAQSLIEKPWCMAKELTPIELQEVKERT